MSIINTTSVDAAQSFIQKKKLDQLREKKTSSAAAKRLRGYDLSVTFMNSETSEIYLSIMLDTVSKSIGLCSDLILVLILVHSNIQPVRLAGSYRCWLVYVREKYCWLIRVNNIYVRGLASQPSQLLPADQVVSWQEVSSRSKRVQTRSRC